MNDEDTELPCAQKMAFASKKEAATAGLAADWQHGVALKPYHCSYCQLWHLSSNS